MNVLNRIHLTQQAIVSKDLYINTITTDGVI